MFVRIRCRTLGGASVGMGLSMERTDITIISITLENRGVDVLGNGEWQKD